MASEEAFSCLPARIRTAADEDDDLGTAGEAGAGAEAEAEAAEAADGQQRRLVIGGRGAQISQKDASRPRTRTS